MAQSTRPTKKRNPQDTTLRNLRALKKQIDEINRRLAALEIILKATLTDRDS